MNKLDFAEITIGELENRIEKLLKENTHIKNGNLVVWSTNRKLKEENNKLKTELAHEIDMNAQGKMKLDIDDVIDNFISILDFDHILAWANILDVEINYPPCDDMWPDWENELAVEVGDAMRKIGERAVEGE